VVTNTVMTNTVVTNTVVENTVVENTVVTNTGPADTALTDTSPVSTDRYGRLDPGDPAQVADYERCFYDAYARLADNRLTRLIWDFDDAAQRLRTRISYPDQIVYTWRNPGGHLAGAMAVNVHPGRVFQGSAFGFAPPAGPSRPGPARTCEILNVMTTSRHQVPAMTSYYAFVRDFGYADLVARGVEIAHSTCTRRRLRPYLRLGAELLAETAIDGEERFFLAWPLRQLLGSGQRPGSGEGPAAPGRC
jgi:hypothetical protein